MSGRIFRMSMSGWSIFPNQGLRGQNGATSMNLPLEEGISFRTWKKCKLPGSPTEATWHLCGTPEGETVWNKRSGVWLSLLLQTCLSLACRRCGRSCCNLLETVFIRLFVVPPDVPPITFCFPAICKSRRTMCTSLLVDECHYGGIVR